jgi:AcrR family transcriptional regulator
MGRKATINREALLDFAEQIVRSGGASALTIGALAEAAGISKGGVQYSFTSKEELVRGIVERWTAQFDALMVQDETDDPIRFVRRYIDASRQSNAAMDSKIAGLMMGYIKDPVNLQATREWYKGIFSRLEGGGKQQQAARVAFLAIEGLFLLRINGIDESGTWDRFLEDVEAVLLHLSS